MCFTLGTILFLQRLNYYQKHILSNAVVKRKSGQVMTYNGQ